MPLTLVINFNQKVLAIHLVDLLYRQLDSKISSTQHELNFLLSIQEHSYNKTSH